MKYTIPKEFKKFVALINPDEFVAELYRLGEIQEISKEYPKNVKLMCNNAIAWILKKIKDTPYIYEVEIAKGHFDEWEHTWIKAGDYYVDITLAQFIDCPALVVSRKGEIGGYSEESACTPFEWVREVILDGNEQKEDKVPTL